MSSFTKRQFFDLSVIIRDCQAISSKFEFGKKVYPRLREILPHEMFAFGRVRISDLRILESMNLTFPPGFFQGMITEEKLTTCPAIRNWIDVRQPILIDEKSPMLQPGDQSWLKKFTSYQIGNIATHGVMNLEQEHACYFAFGGVHSWSKWEIFLLQLLVPHLYYALTNVEDFGNKKPKQILTQREQEVLKWISGGKSNAEIASILGISSWTVKIHVANLLSKLNASTRGHAVAKAVSIGLVEV